MIDNKHINKIVAVAVIFALLFCAAIIYAANAYDSSHITEYQKKLFNGEIATIDIQVDSKDWQDLLDNAEEKDYISGDLVINGEVFDSVGIRAKGNSNLTQIADSESDRYSLNIKFNKYVKGQTYYGLDSLSLNNLIDDPTYTKEYLSYDIMRYIGVPTPLTNYAKITVNGEDYGFMLLLERYDYAFLDRVYDSSKGHLYNVKKDMDTSDEFDMTGGSLVYSGDDIGSYASIFKNAVFGKTDEKDNQRVIMAIKNLNEGTELEQYWDVDEILRYFAAHTAIVNLNSYISAESQNYYIYERDGKLTILPWSYNEAFGGNLKTNSKTLDVVNLPIDTPVYGVDVDMEDRPLLNVLLAIPEYKEKYHGYLNQIVEGYFDSGLFEKTIDDLDAKIGDYVKTDVSAFHTYGQYKESLPKLIELGRLRAQSIAGQLDASIPSTTAGQNADKSALIDIASISPSTYTQKLFDGEVASLDIQIDGEDWQDFLKNAQSKEWACVDLTINGELFNSVGIRAKGNSSLSQSGAMGRSGSSETRYSLQFKMNKYVSGQTYYGLDVFCVNNMMGDATYMKDYISFDIMNYIGVSAVLANYANITVNGENYGFGVLLERYEKSFLDRSYNTTDGYLYNVKIQMGQRENFQNFGRAIEEGDGESNEQANRPAQPIQPDRNANRGNRDMGGGFGGFGGSRGGSLVYADDELSSYSSIFDNAVFGEKTTEEDMQCIVSAIKNLNEGTDLEQYWDIDGVLRYFAAHTVVVNLDSYISNMQQNYYLYEKDGKVTILPWDYNLAFGGYQSGSASSFVNFPIDTPVSGVDMEDRPLLNVLLEIPEYKERYHAYLREIVEGYFYSGLFEETVKALDAKINEYVKNDANVYFTHEQYEASLPVFIEACMLRAESIAGQLDKTIPSTTAGQREDPSALVDASSIDMSALGSMMGGGGMGDRGGFDGNMPGMPEGFERDFENMPEDFGGRRPGNMPGGDMPDWFDGQFPEGMPEEFQDWFAGQQRT